MSSVIHNKPLSATLELMVMRWLLESPEGWGQGPVASGTNLVIRGWELSASPLTSGEGREGLELGSITNGQSLIISHACVMQPP